MAIPFPPALWPVRIGFSLENASRSGGASITGAEQVVVSASSRWRASATFNLVGEWRVLSWRAFLASLDGRAGEFEIGPFDRFRPHDVNGRRLSNVPAAKIGDDLLFDLSALGQTETTHATLAANAALRATRVTLTAAPSWTVPRPGQYFGIGARLYIARAVYRATESDPWTVDFRPGLRTAATAGDRVILDRPVCTMRLASDDTGALDLEFARYGQATLEMVEAV
jgi:hypothetical protein